MRCENPPGSAPTEPDKSADIAKVKRALGALKTFVGYFHVGIFFLERSKEKKYALYVPDRSSNHPQLFPDPDGY